MPANSAPPVAETKKEIQSIDTLTYTNVPLSSFDLKYLPPLPSGIWHDGKRLTGYKMNPDICEDSRKSYELSSPFSAMENQKVDTKKRFRDLGMALCGYSDTKKTVPPMLLEIGGMPVKDLAVAKSQSPVDMITSMSFKDVAVLSLAIRLTLKSGDKGYVVDRACPHKGCPMPGETLRLSCSLDELTINYPDNLEGESVFRVNLKHGFYYQDVKIDYLDLGLIKLYQLPELIESRGNGKDPFASDLTLSLVDIPQMGSAFSELKRLKRLGEVIKLLTLKDVGILRKALDKLDKLGSPSMDFNPSCGCFQDEKVPVTFTWFSHSGIYLPDTSILGD